jgi:hypothetical protein
MAPSIQETVPAALCFGRGFLLDRDCPEAGFMRVAWNALCPVLRRGIARIRDRIAEADLWGWRMLNAGANSSMNAGDSR